MAEITRETLRDYLTDSLPDAELATVEAALRESPDVAILLEAVRTESERQDHSVGSVWRELHLTCPTRDQLGAYLLQALDPEFLDYIEFHLDTVGCAYCRANLDDLKRKQVESQSGLTTSRLRKIVESSAGTLREITQPR